MAKLEKIIDTILPVSTLALAKDHKGNPIQYFGVPVFVNLDRGGLTTCAKASTKKLVDVVNIDLENASKETISFLKTYTSIDIDKRIQSDEPFANIVVVDERLLRKHLFNMNNKKIHAVLAFYAASIICSRDEDLFDKHLESLSELSAAYQLCKNLSVESSELDFDSDMRAMKFLLTAEELGFKPTYIEKAVNKNEHGFVKQTDRFFKKATKVMRKSHKLERKAKSHAQKAVDERADFMHSEEPSDDDIVVESVPMEKMKMDSSVFTPPAEVLKNEQEKKSSDHVVVIGDKQ